MPWQQRATLGGGGGGVPGPCTTSGGPGEGSLSCCPRNGTREDKRQRGGGNGSEEGRLGTWRQRLGPLRVPEMGLTRTRQRPASGRAEKATALAAARNRSADSCPSNERNCARPPTTTQRRSSQPGPFFGSGPLAPVRKAQSRHPKSLGRRFWSPAIRRQAPSTANEKFTDAEDVRIWLQRSNKPNKS